MEKSTPIISYENQPVHFEGKMVKRDLNFYSGPEGRIEYSYSVNDCVIPFKGSSLSTMNQEHIGIILSDIVKIKFNLEENPSPEKIIAQNKNLVDRLLKDFKPYQ